jgi:DNA/RNA-binding protein KIN17
MLKKMAKRAQEEAEAKKAIEAKRAAAATAMAQKENTTPPAEGSPAPVTEKKVDSPVDDQNKKQEEKESEEPKAEAVPVKLSFGMKAKVAPPNKAGLGQMKSQSIFKRKKDDTLEQKPVKKVKL